MSHFKTQQDVWEYLFNGGKVRCIIVTELGYYALNAGRVTWFTTLGTTPSVNSFTSPEKYTPVMWYDDIPEEGVLCWVGDNQFATGYIRCIVRYEPAYSDQSPFYSSKGNSHPYATPLTKDEINQFLINAPD